MKSETFFSLFKTHEIAQFSRSFIENISVEIRSVFGCCSGIFPCNSLGQFGFRTPYAPDHDAAF